MPAYARREIADDDEVGVYHCGSRCVRREFLCGDDPFTGRNCDHLWPQAGESIVADAGIAPTNRGSHRLRGSSG